MTDDRLPLAIGRLERAVAKLESRPSPTGDAQQLKELQMRHAQLEARHEALRLRTAAAVERLSQLLDTAKGD